MLNLPSTKAGTHLTIAVIDWCPYICNLSSDRPGLLVELVEHIYRDNEVQLGFSLFPWSRAINMVESGKYMALLAPAKNEAPNLLYPAIPIGVQRFCFFSRANDEWQYQNPEKAMQRSVVYPADALPEEFKRPTNDNPNFKSFPYDVRFLDKTTRLLLNGLVDSILITEFSMLYYQKQQNLQGEIKNSGCASQSDLYLAFTPRAKFSQDVIHWQALSDKVLSSPETQEVIRKIMAKYGI